MEASVQENGGGDDESDLENAGSLLIEKNSAAQSNQNPINKAAALHGLENPTEHASIPINVLTPITAPQIDLEPMIIPQPTSQTSSVFASTPPAEPTPSSPLVDRLMAKPTATANETVVRKMAPPTPSVPSSRPGSDPYREPIE